MHRIEIIDTIGRTKHVENIEGGEFSYKKVLSNVVQAHWKLDIRFYDPSKKIAVLVEAKQRQKDSDKAQLFDYVVLEQRINRDVKIIAILADTSDSDKIRVWKVWRNSIEELQSEMVLKSFDEYARLFERQTYNNAQAVLVNTNLLNELLQTNGIKEGKRSQFVGTCMLALKNGLQFKDRTTSEILSNIKEKLGEYLQSSVNKAEKIALLSTNVLQDQNVEVLDADHFAEILEFINENILPYIKDDSTKGQDILSYFFTTFTKYVNRGDKNQAFTPNHIAHFMCKVGGIHKDLRVFDPTCGSGTFLVQAMTQILGECNTAEERERVKKEQIYGIEYDRDVYGLATTNMLIHSDGNSNIVQASCFDKEAWIKQQHIGLVLMNPPYNAQKTVVPKSFASTWGTAKEDPSKGLYFVKYIANTIGQGRLLTLLPMQCAIKSNGIIADIKSDLLRHHTLDAVFSFPAEMFYPGASAVACCMVLKLGQPHPKNYETFFGYFKDDGFEKRKGVGRTDIKGRWSDIEDEWLYLYEHRMTEPGLSVMKRIESGNEEWTAESYMETDYSNIKNSDFIKTLQLYSSFLLKSIDPFKSRVLSTSPILGETKELNTDDWKWFNYYGDNGLFDITGSSTTSKDELIESGVGPYPYVTTQAVDNGIEGFYNISTENGGVLTVDSAVLGYCAYQENNFAASDHVEKLIPKFAFNKYLAMFLVTLINKEQYRFNYGRKASQTKLKAAKIKLPATESGDPDWKWMEDYIKSLPFSAII